jgi:toxin ParE1/3/4
VRLVWSSESEADRLSIFKYIAADNPTAAFDMETLFDDRAERLDRVHAKARRRKEI